MLNEVEEPPRVDGDGCRGAGGRKSEIQFSFALSPPPLVRECLQEGQCSCSWTVTTCCMFPDFLARWELRRLWNSRGWRSSSFWRLDYRHLSAKGPPSSSTLPRLRPACHPKWRMRRCRC